MGIFDIIVKSKTGKGIGANSLWLNPDTNQLMIKTKDGWEALNDESASVLEVQESINSLKSQLETLSESVENLDTSVASVVTELPTEDIKENKIYLVKSSTVATDNLYTEYLYVDGAWEILGNTSLDIDLTEYLTTTEAEETYATISSLEEGIAALTPQVETIEGVEVKRYCGGNIWVLEDAVTLSSEFETWVEKSKVCGRDDCRLILVHQKNDNNEQTGLLINTLFSNKQEAKQIFFWGKSVHSRKIMGIDMTADPDTAYSDGNGSGTSGSGSWQTDFGYHLAVSNNVLTLSDYDNATIASVTLPSTDLSGVESSVTELTTKVSAVQTDLKTTSDELGEFEGRVYTKEEIDTKLAESGTFDSTQYYTKDEISNIEINLQDSIDNAKETVSQKAVSTDAGLDIPLLAAGSSSTDAELSQVQKTNGVFYSSNFNTGDTYYGVKVKDESSTTSILPSFVEVESSGNLADFGISSDTVGMYALHGDNESYATADYTSLKTGESENKATSESITIKTDASTNTITASSINIDNGSAITNLREAGVIELSGEKSDDSYTKSSGLSYDGMVFADSNNNTNQLNSEVIIIANSNTNTTITSNSIKISDETTTDESIYTSVSQDEIAIHSSNDSNAMMGFVQNVQLGDSNVSGLVLSNSSEEYLNAMPEGLYVVSTTNNNIGGITPDTLGIQQGEGSYGLGQTGILGKVGDDYAMMAVYNNNYNGGSISTSISAEGFEITDSSSGESVVTFKVSDGTVTATNFEGLASKATADADGNVITETYAKSEDLNSLQQAYEKDLTTEATALEEMVNTTNTNVSTLQSAVSSLSSTVTIDTQEVNVYMGGLVADLGTFDNASTAESFIARADVCGVYTIVTFKMQNDNNTKTAIVFNTLYNSGKSAYQKYTLGQNEYYRHISDIDLENPTGTTVDSWTAISYSA